jgi:hypothetical protein
VIVHIQSEYNLCYINCSTAVDLAYKNICNIGVSELSKSDLKKLLFHFIVIELLNISRGKKFTEKPVFFLYKKYLTELPYDVIEQSIVVIKLFKNYLPVPFIVLDDGNVFKKNKGELKELNERLVNFYIKRKHCTRKLRKFLQKEEFYELINILKDVNNIKTITN